MRLQERREEILNRETGEPLMHIRVCILKEVMREGLNSVTVQDCKRHIAGVGKELGRAAAGERMGF